MGIDVDKLVEMRESGATYVQIGEVLGMSKSAVSTHCLKRAIEKPNPDGRSRCWVGVRGPLVTADGKRRFAPEDDKLLLRLLGDGKTPTEIANGLDNRWKPPSIAQRIKTLARREERKASKL